MAEGRCGCGGGIAARAGGGGAVTEMAAEREGGSREHIIIIVLLHLFECAVWFMDGSDGRGRNYFFYGVNNIIMDLSGSGIWTLSPSVMFAKTVGPESD